MPEVIDGARTPIAERGVSQRGPGRRPTVIPEGKRMFQFNAMKYQLQVTAPDDLILMDGRKIRGKRPRKVVADDGIALLDVKKDADLILAIEGGKDPETGEILPPHPSYGIDFFDFADILQKAKQAQEDAAVSYVLKDASPEVKAKILEALTASADDEFTNPDEK